MLSALAVDGAKATLTDPSSADFDGRADQSMILVHNLLRISIPPCILRAATNLVYIKPKYSCSFKFLFLKNKWF